MTLYFYLILHAVMGSIGSLVRPHTHYRSIDERNELNITNKTR